MEILVASHPSFLEHDTGLGHPERPERVEAVRAGVEDAGVELRHIEAPSVERTDLEAVHDPSYVEMIELFCSIGGGALDMDTFVSAESWEASLRSAGAVVGLVEELETEGDTIGFALCRPPGHHALADRAMGFCLFNNVAIAAARLRAGGSRVAILDWDVHHGNGTQSILGDDPGTLYVSVHQDNFYPYEGAVTDIDRGEAPGTNVNIPLPAGTGGGHYRRAWAELVIPVTRQFEPDWVLVSNGYDAHIDDPLGSMRLEADDFGFMAGQLSAAHPSNRTVVALEGGYSLDGLRESAEATVRGLAGNDGGWADPEMGNNAADRALEAALTAASRHWRL